LWGSCITCFIIHGDITVRVSPRGSATVLNLVESKDSRHDSSFVAFCFFGIINSLYSLSWVSFGFLGDRPWLTVVRQDLLVDWSVLRPHARFFFLRDELIYSNWISVRCFSSFRDLLSHHPDQTPCVALLPFHSKGITLCPQRAVQLTHCRRSPTLLYASCG
jgi:hypothetical protein